MRAAITGGTGFVGTHIADDLAPRALFTDDEIRRALPEAGRFGWRDLRVSR